MEEEKKCDCGCEHKVNDCDENCKCHGENKCGCHEENHKNKKEHKDHHLEKLKKAMKEIDDLNEENLRVKAELVNYRKRKDEEVTRMLKYANEDLAKEIESEIKSKVKEKVIIKTPTYKTYYGGYQQSWNTNLTKEKKTIITDSKEFFNELTDIEIFYIAETLENGGALSDLFEDYEFKGTTEYEIEDMVLEYSEAYPEKYYEYLSTGGY